MLPLFLPRRFRRPLLFPPGLLALAGLLWLGCVALPQMRGIISGQQAVIEITVNPQVNTADLKYAHPAFRRWLLNAWEPNSQWNSVSFNGHLFEDYFVLRQAQQQVEYMRNKPLQKDSLRVQFSEHASYRSLVQMLNMAQRPTTVMYWLDFRMRSTTLYIFPRGREHEEKWVCGPMSTDWFSQPWHSQFWLLIHNRRHIPYFYPEWRNTWLLLLLLSLLSGWRVARQWRPAA